MSRLDDLKEGIYGVHYVDVAYLMEQLEAVTKERDTARAVHQVWVDALASETGYRQLSHVLAAYRSRK